MNDYNNFLDLMRKNDSASPVPPKKPQVQPAVNKKQPIAKSEQLDKPIHPTDGQRQSAISASPFLEQLPEEVLGANANEDILTLKRERSPKNAPAAAAPTPNGAVSVAQLLSEEQKAAVEELSAALHTPTPPKAEPQPAPEPVAEPVPEPVAEPAPEPAPENKKSERSLFERTKTLHGIPSAEQKTQREQRTKLLNRSDKMPEPEKTRHIGSNFTPTAGLRKTDGDDISVFFPAAQDDKGSLLRALAKSAAIEEAPEVEQLEMAGFAQPEPEITDEDSIEEEVRLVREKRIEEFGLGAQAPLPAFEDNEANFKNPTAGLPGFIKKTAERFADKKTPFAPVKGDEYTSHTERRFAFRALLRTRKNTFIRTGILAGIGLVLLLTNIITTASAAANNGFFTVFGANTALYTSFNLLLLLAAAVLLLPDFKNAAISLLQLHPRTEAALLGMYITVLAQTVSQYFTAMQPESSYHLFTGAAVLLSAIYMFSKTLWYESTRHCFSTLSMTGSKHYLREIRSPKALRELLSQQHTEGLRADFSARTAFISSFFEDSANSARSAMPKSFLVPVSWLLCLLCGVVTAISAKSPVVGLSAAAAACCFAFPVCSLISCGLMMRNTNKKLSTKKSYIMSLQDARGFVTVDHFAFDADELFDVSLRHTYTIDSVAEINAVTAASVLAYHAGGTLAAAFCADRDMKDKKLPQTEELVYEEKMGICAWIDNCRVLLGTAEMLRNHNVEPGTIPQTDPDCQLLHLAVEGKPIAAFALHYSCAKDKAQGLRNAAVAGVNLLIRASDPLVTPAMVQTLVDLPDNSIKVVSKSGAELFDNLHDSVSEHESTGIVTANGFSGLCLCADTAVKLEHDSHLTGVVTAACSLIGAAAALLLSFTGGISRATGWSAVLLQLLWTGLAIAVPMAYSLLESKKKEALLKKAAHKKAAEKADRPQPAQAPVQEEELPPEETAEEAQEPAQAEEELPPQESDEETEEKTNAPVKTDEHLDFLLQAGFEDIFGIHS